VLVEPAATAPVAESSVSRPGAFRAPPLGRHHVTRGRVDALLDEALEASLVLVSAPAGAGKSTALSGWLARRDGGGRWYSIEAEDNDPAVFWPSLAEALGLSAASHVTGAREVARAIIALETVPPGTPTVLVLDDYHAVTNPSIHAGMDQLLVEAPSSLRVLIVTRHDPPLMLARLRAHDALREIRFDDLRFDHSDVAALLNDQMSMGLTQPELTRLADRTEGWPVGVQLVGLSLRNHADRGAFIEEFAGDNRHVADYLRDEVLARLPDRVRGFLLDTAILDRLTAPLCHAVSGVEDSQEILEELDRLNLFIIPLDNRRRWFRYHHLFAEWLRLQATSDPRDRHHRAADWLAHHGFPGDAVRHYVAAGDADRAADVIDRAHWILVGQGREETLRDWTQQLPGDVLSRRPRLTLAAAWVAHKAGRWSDVRDLIGAFEAAVAQHDEHDAALVQAEVALLDAGRLVAQGDVAEAARIAQGALHLVPRHEPRARTGLLLVLGRCRLAEGDLDGARRAFTDADELAAPFSAVSIVQLIARAHLAEIDRRAGNRAVAEAASRAVIEFADAAGLADNPECTVAHLTLGNVLLDRGHIEEAAEAITRGTELAHRIPYVARETAAAAANERLADLTPGRVRTGLVEELTGREHSVLRLLPTSLTPREIASELYLSLNTIKTHTRAIYRKLGVQTRHDAIEEARRRNLL
jgi:ATP/maltotriose-dependent transcriptional regulator MalT